MAGGAAIGGILSVVGDIVSAKMASDSQQKAAKNYLKGLYAQIEANYRLNQENRGSTGSAILPLYAPAGTEANLFGGAQNIFDATGGLYSPTGQVKANRDILAGFQPAIQAGDETINSIFNRGLTTERLGYAQPVADARTKLAATSKAGVYQGLQAELNRLKAGNNIVGGGSFLSNRLLQTSIPYYQQAAGYEGQAALENAEMFKAINDADPFLRLQYLNAPQERAASAIALQSLPQQAVIQQWQNRMQPFDWFRLQQQPAFQQPYAPQSAYPSVPGTGQILGTALSQAGSALGNYYANQQLMKQLFPQGGGGTTSGSASGVGDFDMSYYS